MELINNLFALIYRTFCPFRQRVREGTLVESARRRCFLRSKFGFSGNLGIFGIFPKFGPKLGDFGPPKR